MQRLSSLILLPLALGLGGCLSTAASIVKAPFQAASGAVDMMTTSQSEADQNRGRRERKEEEREAKEQRRAAEYARKHPTG